MADENVQMSVSNNKIFEALPCGYNVILIRLHGAKTSHRASLDLATSQTQRKLYGNSTRGNYNLPNPHDCYERDSTALNMADSTAPAPAPTAKSNGDGTSTGSHQSNSAHTNSRGDRGGPRGRGGRGRGDDRGRGQGRGGGRGGRGGRGGSGFKGFGAKSSGPGHKKADRGRGEYE